MERAYVTAAGAAGLGRGEEREVALNRPPVAPDSHIRGVWSFADVAVPVDNGKRAAGVLWGPRFCSIYSTPYKGCFCEVRPRAIFGSDVVLAPLIHWRDRSGEELEVRRV